MQKFYKILLVLALVGCFCFCASAQTLAVEQQVYTYLTNELELPSAAACGILANMEAESAFHVTAVGDGGTSFGLCQWHAGRYQQLKTHCAAKGLDYRTVEGQMDYLSTELRTVYPSLLMSLRMVEDTPNGAYQAAYLWCTQFERPADAENKAISRGVLAKGKYWNRYNIPVVTIREEPTLTQEDVVKVITQNKVTIPQNPDSVVVHTGQAVAVLSTNPYAPRHAPAQEPQMTPSLSFAVSVLFLPAWYQKNEDEFTESAEQMPQPQDLPGFYKIPVYRTAAYVV